MWPARTHGAVARLPLGCPSMWRGPGPSAPLPPPPTPPLVHAGRAHARTHMHGTARSSSYTALPSASAHACAHPTQNPAAARLQVGWDVESDGLTGAPAISIYAGEESHSSVFKALGVVGLGRGGRGRHVTRLAADTMGAVRASSLTGLPPPVAPAIVVLQASTAKQPAPRLSVVLAPRSCASSHREDCAVDCAERHRVFFCTTTARLGMSTVAPLTTSPPASPGHAQASRTSNSAPSPQTRLIPRTGRDRQQPQAHCHANEPTWPPRHVPRRSCPPGALHPNQHTGTNRCSASGRGVTHTQCAAAIARNCAMA